MREVVPTRSEARALAEERQLLRDGHQFLDEKRTLLAGEMLRQLAVYDRLRGELDEARRAALAGLGEAIERHGLEALQARAKPAPLVVRNAVAASFLGVTIMRPEATLPVAAASPPQGASRPRSAPSLGNAAAAFARLARLSCEAGLVGGNLMRLAHEYRRTERRAKALENVLMPELDAVIKLLVEQLDSMEQEEAVRVRLLSRAAG